MAARQLPSQKLNGEIVSRETVERFERFAVLFQKWAKSINLVAPSTLPDIWSRHIADSAQIYQLSPGPKRWIDLGSGGGFPGIITAIFLTGIGEGWVHLIESNHKKAAFLRAAILETGARASVHPNRIEDCPSIIAHADAISARALAELDLLLDFVSPWAKNNPLLNCFFHKGRDYEAEIRNTHGRWSYDLVCHESKIEKDSVILEISKLVGKN